MLHRHKHGGLVVRGRYVGSAGSLPIWRRIESGSFSARFGSLADRMPRGRLLIAAGAGQPFGDIASRAMSGADVADKDILIPDADGEKHEFVAEAFFNQHNLLIMVTEKKAARFGRRIRVAVS
jgi:hypothetical protein